MSKIEPLTPINASYTGITKLNAHLDKIETALENTVSRDGSAPNFMTADFDMNSNQIINLAEPTLAHHATTKTYVDTFIGAVTGLVLPIAHTWAKLTDGLLTVADYATLSALSSPGENVTYYTRGHTSKNDGGQGTWYFVAGSTAAVNGGTILSGNGGRFFRLTNGYCHPEWFGAVASTSVDSLAALDAMEAAIAAGTCPRRVVCLASTYALTAQWTITTPMNIEGYGDTGTANGTHTTTGGTEFRRIGATTTGAVIRVNDTNFGGMCLKNIALNANFIAQYAFIDDACLGLLAENVRFLEGSVRSCWLIGTTATNSYSSFINCRFENTTDGDDVLRLSGFPAQGNACHLSFFNTLVVHGVGGTGNRHGITLGGCDNVRFFQTFCYCPVENSYSVIVDWTEQGPNFPSNNYFYGLEAVGGVLVPAGGSYTYSPIHVYGLCSDNAFVSRRTITNNSSAPCILINDHGIITGRPEFFAHKNSVDQTGIATLAATKITFSTTRTNTLSRFNTSTSEFTGTGDKYHFEGKMLVIAGIASGAICQLILYENGTPICYSGPARATSANEGFVSLSFDHMTVGGALYALYAYIETGTTGTIYGIPAYTYFSASQI